MNRPADDAPRPMSEAEIDALFAGIGSGAPPPEPPAATDGQDAVADEAVAAEAANPEAEPASSEPEPAAAGGPLSQAAIDELLAAAAPSGAAQPAADAPPTAEPAGTSPQPPTTSEAAAADATSAPTPTPTSTPAAEPAATSAPTDPSAVSAESGRSGSMSQSSIDDLLAEMGLAAGGSKPPAPAPAAEAVPTPVPTPDNQEDSDHLGESSPGDDSLSQESIDELLAGLGKPTASAEPETGSLDQSELAALAQQALAEDSEQDEAAITQADINALVKQLEAHQSEPGAKSGVDFDTLMRAAAVDGPDSGSHLNTVGLALAPQGAGRQSAYLSKDEIRGARFILVVATCLLALSTIALGLVVASVNGLAQQLAENRQANSLPGDSFATDLEVVEAHLRDADPARRELGVRLAERLRLVAEGRERQLLVTRLLANFYRDQGSHRLAMDEFATLLRYLGPLPEEPTLLFEQAQVLRAAGEPEAAFRTISILLANAQYYRGKQANDPAAAQALTDLLAQAWMLRGHLQAERSGGTNTPAVNVAALAVPGAD